MPNVIEILITATDAASAEIKGVEAAAGKFGATMNNIAAQLASPAGIAASLVVIGLAAFEVAEKFGASIIELQNMSVKTGVAVNDLRNLKTVLREAHLPAENLGAALFMLNRRLAEHNAALAALVGDTRDPMEALTRLAQAVADGGNAADVAFKGFGRQGQSLAPILGTLAERMSDVRGRLAQLDPETIRTAKAFDEMVEKMKTSWENFGLSFQKASVWLMTPGFKPPVSPSPMSDAAERGGNVAAARKASVAGVQELVAAFVASKDAAIDSAMSAEFLQKTYDHLVKQGIDPTVASLNRAWTAHRSLIDAQKKAAEALAQMAKQPEQEPGAGKQWYDHLIKQQEEAAKVAKKSADETVKVWATAALSISNSFSTMFDNVLIYGQSFTKSLEKMLQDMAAKIASTAIRIGASLGLSALGTLIGGPFGPIIGAVGGALGGKLAGPHTIVNITAMDARSLVEQIKTPVGSWSRAQNRAAIGTSY